MNKVIDIIKKIGSAIAKFDSVLYKKKIYQFVICGVLCFLFIVFAGNFSNDIVFKNYTEDNLSSFQVTRSSRYKMSFEAGEEQLSYMRIMFNPSRSNLDPNDKMTVTISDEQGYLIYKTEAFLYNAERNYIRVDMDNIELTQGDWYYISMTFEGMKKGSFLTLEAHNTFSFDDTLQLIRDNPDENIALDYSIGFNKVPNINYYFNKVNYFSFAVQALLFIAFIIIIFISRIIDSKKGKEYIRGISLPFLLYILGEILNTEKQRPFQLFLPLTLKYWFCLLVILITIAAFYFFFYMLTGLGTVSSLIVLLLCAVLGFVNHSKLVMRGDSFMPWDLMSAGIAVKTGSTYYFHVTMNFIAGILVAVMILCLIRITHTPYIKFTRNRLYLIFTSGLSVLLMFSGFILNTNLLDSLKIYYQVNPPIQSYNENGTYMAFLMHINNIKANGGENNSPENVSNLIYQYAGIAHEMNIDDDINNLDVKPNVICIMSEAFSDLRTIRGFSTNEPFMPYYDALMDESINGQIAVSIFGGGTCNTEFEFLTGYSIANLLPGSSVYTFYVNNDIQALPRIYSDNGYHTVALHSFDGDWWDRREKYPLLGFDEFYTRDDFDQSARYVRRYISDMSTFEKITDIYEESEEPLFLFCVTMQNHADFSARYDNMTYDIQIEDMMDDNGEHYYYAENYLSLLRESDAALEYLVEYFRECDEPTIIVLFGDHFPTLDQGFYDALLQSDIGAISVEESLPIYETPYILWANFDLSSGGTDLDVSFGNHGVTSPNFLGQTVLDLSGIQSPEQRDCMRVLRRNISGISALSVFDNDGNPHIDVTTLDPDIQQILDDYATIQYGLIYYDDASEADADTGADNSEVAEANIGN